MFLVKALCSINIFCIELSQFCCMDVLQNIAASAQVKELKKSPYYTKSQTNFERKTQKSLKARRVYILFFDFIFKCLPQVSQARVLILNVGIIVSEGWGDKSTKTGVLIKRDKQCERGMHAEMQEMLALGAGEHALLK